MAVSRPSVSSQHYFQTSARAPLGPSLSFVRLGILLTGISCYAPYDFNAWPGSASVLLGPLGGGKKKSWKGERKTICSPMALRRLLLSAIVASAECGCIHTGQTRNLQEDDFDDHVAKSDHLITFVEFSSPWCIWAHPNTGGHGDCATMRQAWDKLGEKVIKMNAAVFSSASAHAILCEPPVWSSTIRRDPLALRRSTAAAS